MAQNKHISIGRLGEDIAADYLKNRGYSIITQNYRKKFGELDIVAEKDGVVHFVEVKAGSWNRAPWPQDGDEVYRPEDHMHATKCLRMSRAIQAYCAENKLLGHDASWTADLVVVLLNTNTRKARITVVSDILLDV